MLTSVAHHTWLPVSPTCKTHHGRRHLCLDHYQPSTLYTIIKPVLDSQTATGLAVCLHRQRQPPGSPFGQCAAWCSPMHSTNTQPGTRLAMQKTRTAKSDLYQRSSFTFFRYLSFTEARFRELNVFSLPTVHPKGNNLSVCLLFFCYARVLETKVCYVVKQLQQMSGHLENIQKGKPNLKKKKKTLEGNKI